MKKNRLIWLSSAGLAGSTTEGGSKNLGKDQVGTSYYGGYVGEPATHFKTARSRESLLSREKHEANRPPWSNPTVKWLQMLTSLQVNLLGIANEGIRHT